MWLWKINPTFSFLIYVGMVNLVYIFFISWIIHTLDTKTLCRSYIYNYYLIFICFLDNSNKNTWKILVGIVRLVSSITHEDELLTRVDTDVLIGVTYIFSDECTKLIFKWLTMVFFRLYHIYSVILYTFCT